MRTPGRRPSFFTAAIPAALCALLALLVPMALRVKEREEGERADITEGRDRALA